MLPKDSRMLKENEYHPLQLKVFFIMITLYTFYFTCNNNLGVATDEIQKSFDLNNAQFGVLFTIFTLGFGAGQFFSGYLGDRYSPKMLMFIGAVGATAANTAFALSSSMAAFCICWAVNALSLAMGWSPDAAYYSGGYLKKRWGLFMGFFDAFCFPGRYNNISGSGICHILFFMARRIPDTRTSSSDMDCGISHIRERFAAAVWF